ncbi:hypothetical protein P154DRAFT_467035 [Amniculicola lignicola CBS 123094]|uniref:Cell surface protein n=1 Tax=Amniculicola lignicola CBS 123094 TaxID=1392246 RepID=A0A6A5WKT0_9PLEO|nr:hypothetical protein P154DRAFT_467035 [Amniculicola lignicola CBS 123094]
MARSTVLMPLYIWPVSDVTWQPLYKAIKDHPQVDFVVVVNPNSGPGSSTLPGHDYEREVPKLNAFPNVLTVGYVLIDYCKRPLHDVCDDIDRYAAWAQQASSLGVGGIFLDETPNHYSAGRALYLTALSGFIKDKEGLLGGRLVIHNPGTPPDAGLGSTGADVIVTCEEPYERYRGTEVQKRLQDYPYGRVRSAYMISAVPRAEMAVTVRELSNRGLFVFATDLVDNFYESFGDSWDDFVASFESV